MAPKLWQSKNILKLMYKKLKTTYVFTSSCIYTHMLCKQWFGGWI